MHDPKFEKEVQQKMEELSFSPPEAVWLKVEKSLRVEKKRRIFPFWFFLVPALLVMGGVAFYFGSKSTPHKGSVTIATPESTTPAPIASARTRVSAGASTPVSGAPNSTSVAPPPTSGAPTPTSGAPIPMSGASTPRSGASTPTSGASNPVSVSVKPNSGAPNPAAVAPATPASGPAGIALRPAPAHAPTPGNPLPPVDRSLAAHGRSNTDQSNSFGSLVSARRGHNAGNAHAGQQNASFQHAGRNNKTPDDPGPVGLVPDPVSLAPGPVGLAPGPVGLASSTHSLHAPVFPGLNAIDRHSSAIKGTSLIIPGRQAALAKTLLPTPKRLWEPGFDGGFGLSSLNHGILDKSTVMASAYRNYATAITGVPQVYITDIQPDVSFWAGVFMEKGLKKDLSLSLGLNLHYYSSRIRTGGKVTANAASAQSSLLTNISYSGAPTVQAYPYYAPYGTQTFINRYYFLELPGSVSWQIGHSRKLPLFWQGGFTLSYLVSSNSLYFNAKSGVFYKDGSVLNKTQVSLSTGLMVGLPFRGMRIQAGPQVQYGFTNMLNNSQGDGGQHLLYGGIKFVFLPGRSRQAR